MQCQCHLGSQGATDLIIDLIISNHSSRIFQEAIELAISLLDGGNSVIQVSLIYGILCACVRCVINAVHGFVTICRPSGNHTACKMIHCSNSQKFIFAFIEYLAKLACPRVIL